LRGEPRFVSKGGSKAKKGLGKRRPKGLDQELPLAHKRVRRPTQKKYGRAMKEKKNCRKEDTFIELRTAYGGRRTLIRKVNYLWKRTMGGGGRKKTCIPTGLHLRKKLALKGIGDRLRPSTQTVQSRRRPQTEGR